MGVKCRADTDTRLVTVLVNALIYVIVSCSGTIIVAGKVVLCVTVIYLVIVDASKVCPAVTEGIPTPPVLLQ